MIVHLYIDAHTLSLPLLLWKDGKSCASPYLYEPTKFVDLEIDEVTIDISLLTGAYCLLLKE